LWSAEALSVSRVLKRAPQYGSAIRTVQKELRKLQKELTEEQATALDTYNSDRCRIENDEKDNTQLKEESEAKIAELESYMASVDQGHVEFTSERVDNEKAVADTNTQIEELTSLIQKTDDDFSQAEAALSDQVAALNEAKSILTASVAGGAALLARPKLSLAEQRTQAKKKNVALTNLLLKVHRFSAEDQDSIRSLITVGDDEVPRSATGSLIGVVDKMLASTEDTLHEHQEEYHHKSANQQETMTNLQEQLDAAQQALADAAGENAARAAEMEESQIALDAAKKNLEQAEYRLERAAAKKMDLDKAFELADEIRGQDLKNIHKATEIINKFMQGSDDEQDAAASAFLQLSLQKQSDGPTVVDSLNLLIERGSELIDDKEGIKNEIKAQVEACQKSLKEFSSSASAASMAWDTSEDSIRESQTAIQNAEHNIADEKRNIEELNLEVNKTSQANDERIAEHEEAVRKVRTENDELKELKTALSEDNSEALMPVITLVENMMSKMDDEIKILTDADAKAQQDFENEITSLTQSIADANEAVVNLNSVIAAQEERIMENRHIAHDQQDITEESAENYRQMRQDCTRLEGAPDLLATLEHEIQGLHKALDALRVITNGA